jgi:ribonucleoside-diphosphate reductase alpha chain
MSLGFYSLATPVWTNFGNQRGLPISCFGSYIEDNMGSILFTLGEVGMMSKFGGGTSAYFGELRPRGSLIKSDYGKTSGSVHFMQLFDKIADVISQGSTRRGQFAPYLPIDHGDIEEFLDIGTEGHPIQKITYGVTVTDEWLHEMLRVMKKKEEFGQKLFKEDIKLVILILFLLIMLIIIL